MALLRENAVALLADIRTVPASRRVPHFARTSLERELPAAGIGYVHLPGLGGLRKPRRDSVNTGWRNESFRGYADYMQEPAFEQELRRLQGQAQAQTIALMCAEAVPWRCHRSLVADALAVRGADVLHILGSGKLQPHQLTPFARVEGGRLTYPTPTS